MANTSPALPKLDVPAKTWVLYENIAVQDVERTGNWRFLIKQDGCYFHAQNIELRVSAAQISSDDPALHWNTPLPASPIRCFTEAQQSDLKAALQTAKPASLSARYPATAGTTSHQSAERWTIRQGDKTYTIVVENGAAPAALVQLRQTIDQLVASAPRVDTK